MFHFVAKSNMSAEEDASDAEDTDAAILRVVDAGQMSLTVTGTQAHGPTTVDDNIRRVLLKGASRIFFFYTTTHINTQAHTDTPRIHTFLHTHTYTHAYTPTPTHTYTHKHTRANTHLHKRVHTYLNTHLHTPTHTHLHTRLHP